MQDSTSSNLSLRYLSKAFHEIDVRGFVEITEFSQFNSRTYISSDTAKNLGHWIGTSS